MLLNDKFQIQNAKSNPNFKYQIWALNSVIHLVFSFYHLAFTMIYSFAASIRALKRSACATINEA